MCDTRLTAAEVAKAKQTRMELGAISGISTSQIADKINPEMIVELSAIA